MCECVGQACVSHPSLPPLCFSRRLSSFTELQHSTSRLVLQRTCLRTGAERRGTGNKEQRRTPAKGVTEKRDGKDLSTGRRQESKKIENQEKRSLKGAERSGVWRRGDKGRGLTRGRDKYGAMHHSGNTGRAKTLSHETGKRPSDASLSRRSQTSWCRTPSSKLEHRSNWSVTQRQPTDRTRLQIFVMISSTRLPRACVSSAGDQTAEI